MSDKAMLRLLITVVIVCAISFVALIIVDNTEEPYIFEQITVSAGDTFWSYYNDGYYANMSYSEALYTFKQDNGKENASLFAGKSIVLRKVVE